MHEMTPRQIQPWNESLDDYYHYIMQYLHDKYDRHSIDPVYMSEKRMAELSQYEAQARRDVARYEAQQAVKGSVENPYTPAEWRALHR